MQLEVPAHVLFLRIVMFQGNSLLLDQAARDNTNSACEWLEKKEKTSVTGIRCAIFLVLRGVGWVVGLVLVYLWCLGSRLSSIKWERSR